MRLRLRLPLISKVVSDDVLLRCSVVIMSFKHIQPNFKRVAASVFFLSTEIVSCVLIRTLASSQNHFEKRQAMT